MAPTAVTMRPRRVGRVVVRAGGTRTDAMVTIGGLDSPVGPGPATGAVAIVDGFGVGPHSCHWDGGE